VTGLSNRFSPIADNRGRLSAPSNGRPAERSPPVSVGAPHLRISPGRVPHQHGGTVWTAARSPYHTIPTLLIPLARTMSTPTTPELPVRQIHICAYANVDALLVARSIPLAAARSAQDEAGMSLLHHGCRIGLTVGSVMTAGQRRIMWPFAVHTGPRNARAPTFAGDRRLLWLP
jgi:hypothetical protein